MANTKNEQYLQNCPIVHMDDNISNFVSTDVVCDFIVKCFQDCAISSSPIISLPAMPDNDLDVDDSKLSNAPSAYCLRRNICTLYKVLAGFDDGQLAYVMGHSLYSLQLGHQRVSSDYTSGESLYAMYQKIRAMFDSWLGKTQRLPEVLITENSSVRFDAPGQAVLRIPPATYSRTAVITMQAAEAGTPIPIRTDESKSAKIVELLTTQTLSGEYPSALRIPLTQETLTFEDRAYEAQKEKIQEQEDKKKKEFKKTSC